MIYQAIPVQTEDIESRSSGEDSCQDVKNLEQYQIQKRFGRRWVPFLLSAVLNIALALLLLRLNNQCTVSQYAGLLPELSLPWVESTEFSSGSFLESNEHWESISFDEGIIALDNDYVKSKGLPSSVVFPWDTSKSMYLVNGFHSLHCIKTVHTSLMEFKLSKQQTYPFEHILHCMDSLRLEIICTADDTPRYHNRNGSMGTAVGQHRQCRDWSKLESWVQERTACYRYLNYSANTADDQYATRFSFCPPGSPYAAKVEEYLVNKTGI